MYITGKYWENDVGDTDDSLTLVEYLAALLLECKINRNIELCELSEADPDTMAVSEIRITATPEEYLLIGKVLADFTSDPLAYDLSEMCTEEEMRETAAVCEALRKELYEGTKEQNT